MRILFLGDIVGRPGRRVARELLPDLRDSYSPDVVLANGENAAGGFGLTQKVLDGLYDMGIDVVTTGNHVWDKKEVLGFINEEERLLRPANYPTGVPGKGFYRLSLSGARCLWVINLQGRIFMQPIDCPFRKADEILAEIPPSERCIFVDMHAEATSEKRAMGYYLDGRVSLVVGTHTHVPTADEEILPKGAGYLTDAGMTGAYASVIGTRQKDSLERIILGVPRVLNVAKGGLRLGGLFAEIDDVDGRCLKIERIFRKLEP